MRRVLLSVALGCITALTLSVVGAGAAPKDDPVRDGPPDGPRGRSQRTPAAPGTDALSDFWPESPRVEVPNKGEVIPDHYIVVFQPGTPGAADLARRITQENGGELTYTYEHALQGFAASFTPARIDAIRRNPNVVLVESDRVVGAEDTQSPATWGLDRIDQQYLPLDNSYSDDTEGAGVHAYVIDTGIRKTHTEFAGRMGTSYYDAVTSGGAANDCNGHGTHVAGTIGGSSYGVADKVRVHAVRVLDCNGSGSNSGVIAGVDWVRANAIKPAVANMSLGGSASTALDSAVSNAIASGITFAVAAGNSNADACSTSPARVGAAITVGATTNTDNRSSFSNIGSCLDLFAPGSGITSAWNSSDTATNTISGTSMASPHVAGAAALYLSNHTTATPQQVRDALVNLASVNAVINAGSGSPNRLLRTPGSGSTPPPPPPPPPPPTAPSAIVNGGFENGSTGWTQSSSGGYSLIQTTKPHSGSYSVWEGGYNSANETIGQAITVPTGASLRYYWFQTSNEATAAAYDYLRVQVYNASTGAIIATLRTWSNMSARNAWNLDTLSLSAYAGQTIRIQFTTTTDSSIPTSFYIDDVSVG